MTLFWNGALAIDVVAVSGGGGDDFRIARTHTHTCTYILFQVSLPVHWSSFFMGFGQFPNKLPSSCRVSR